MFLTAYDHHSAWVNSKALEIAGITRQTPDPPNGKIVRDPKNGEATGMLQEAPAQQLIEQQQGLQSFLSGWFRDNERVDTHDSKPIG